MQPDHNILSLRFTGDSGDGIQLIGQQLMLIAALHGLEVRSLPDFPAEIRAPAGTVAGVSGLQLGISGQDISTAGDKIDLLVAFNPAALMHSIADLQPGAIIYINACQFNDKDWQKAKADPSVLEALAEKHQIITVPILKNTLAAVQELTISTSAAKRCKNFYVLGMMLFLFDLSLDKTREFIANKFRKQLDILNANQLALSAGYHFAMTQQWHRPYFIRHEESVSGEYRQVNGAEAVAMALASLATAYHRTVFVAGYPITPSSVILHECAHLHEYGVELFQAEDEIAAVCACLGAAFGGSLALTTTSGPGFDLKMEGIGLGVVAELPMLVLDVQRAGASTGLPTKTSQADLRQALYGRHGESPIPVLAAQSSSDCFATILEAFSIAIMWMTPVIVLLDAYLMNASEPWRIPEFSELNIAKLDFYQETQAFKRLENGARSWNPPGHPDYIHQLGGLEKQGDAGKVSYDADNHAKMNHVRQHKLSAIAAQLPPIISGTGSAILVISWGSTFGVMKSSLDLLREAQIEVDHIHLKHLNPLPNDLGVYLEGRQKILVFELNSGHLTDIIRAQYLVDAQCVSQVNGKTFTIESVHQEIKKYYE